MKSVIIEAENIASATEKAYSALRVNKDYIDVLEIGENQFEAKVNTSLESLIEDYLAKFFDECYISFELTVKKDEKSITFNIDTADNPLLIGREGKVLNSLQFIIRQIAFIYSDEFENVSVDVGGYKASRNLHLEMLATKTAKEVSRTKISAELKGLNSYERRIVHAKLSEWRDVETNSFGVEPNRYLVITPKNKNK